MIQIANPIYDVVFKYMMSDNKVAKLLLSAIIGNEIIDLILEPTETPLPLQETITVLRMDFKATVKYEDGTQQVIIIELQKAKLHTDIMRFRRYLGQQYSDKNNSIVTSQYVTKNKKIIETRDGLPLLSIYILGYPLDYAINIPVIKVARTYIDIATGEELKNKEKFIESLTHDSFIIQIPYIHQHRRTELEQLLYIFDQSEIDKNKAHKHFLNIKEEEIPKRYRPVLRRLLSAVANPKMRNIMAAEDELIDELQNYSRQVNDMKERIVEKDKALKEQYKVLEEKDKALEVKDKAMENAITEMLAMNIPIKKIASMFNTSIEFVTSLKK